MLSKDEKIKIISENFCLSINEANRIYSCIDSITDHNREFEKENVENFYEELCIVFNLCMYEVIDIEKIVTCDVNIEKSICKICEFIECPIDHKYCRMTPEEEEKLERCKIKTEPIIGTEKLIIPISQRLSLCGDDEKEKLIQKLLAKRKENQKREIDLEQFF